MKYLHKCLVRPHLWSMVWLILSTVIYSQSTISPAVLKGGKLAEIGIGGIGYTTSKQRGTASDTPKEYKTDANYFAISIYPTMAWFVADRLAVGSYVSLGYNSGSSKDPDVPGDKYSYDQIYFYLGPLARYYFGSSSRGMPFVQLNAEYGFYAGKSENTRENKVNTSKTRPRPQLEFAASGGYEAFISDQVGLFITAGVYYNYNKSEYEYIPATGEGYISKGTDSRWNFPLRVGLQLHFPPKSGRK